MNETRNRATDVEYQKRLDVVMGLMVRGLPTSQIVKVACQQWDVSERQAGRYIQAVKEREQEALSFQREGRFCDLFMQLKHIYQQAVLLEDWNLALRTVSARAELIRREQRGELEDGSIPRQSGIVSPAELEAVLQSLESETRNESD